MNPVQVHLYIAWESGKLSLNNGCTSIRSNFRHSCTNLSIGVYY